MQKRREACSEEKKAQNKHLYLISVDGTGTGKGKGKGKWGARDEEKGGRELRKWDVAEERRGEARMRMRMVGILGSCW
ncbi:MAG: hypothetical protein Q9169_004442 [Polycauliona sp. 2 TL-2023]